MSNIKAVLWDVDGTLLDFLAAEREAIKTCFSLFGLGECTDEMIAQYSAINVRWWQALERGEYTKPEILVGRFAEFSPRAASTPPLPRRSTRNTSSVSAIRSSSARTRSKPCRPSAA